MEKRHDILFTPMKIGNVEIRNRFVEAPMEGTCIIEWTQETKYNAKARDYYIERAKNEMGLFIPGLAPLRSMIGGKWLHKHPKVFQEAAPLLVPELPIPPSTTLRPPGRRKPSSGASPSAS